MQRIIDEMGELDEIENPVPFTWDWSRHHLRKTLLENECFDGFLRWPVVEGNMVINDVEATEHDWPIVRDWWNKYHSGPVPVDPMIGGSTGIVTRDGYTTTINAIRQLRHLAILESSFGVELDNDVSIIEFGGGYGLLAYLIRQTGFEGQYTIYDFPEFSLLQKYYLGEAGCDTVNLISSLDEVEGCDLLIALDSLTEVNDLGERRRFMLRALPEEVFIRFAPFWGGVDNGDWLESMRFYYLDTRGLEDGYVDYRSYWFATNRSR